MRPCLAASTNAFSRLIKPFGRWIRIRIGRLEFRLPPFGVDGHPIFRFRLSLGCIVEVGASGKSRDAE